MLKRAKRKAMQVAKNTRWPIPNSRPRPINRPASPAPRQTPGNRTVRSAPNLVEAFNKRATRPSKVSSTAAKAMAPAASQSPSRRSGSQSTRAQRQDGDHIRREKYRDAPQRRRWGAGPSSHFLGARALNRLQIGQNGFAGTQRANGDQRLNAEWQIDIHGFQRIKPKRSPACTVCPSPNRQTMRRATAGDLHEHHRFVTRRLELDICCPFTSLALSRRR